MWDADVDLVLPHAPSAVPDRRAVRAVRGAVSAGELLLAGGAALAPSIDHALLRRSGVPPRSPQWERLRGRVGDHFLSDGRLLYVSPVAGRPVVSIVWSRVADAALGTRLERLGGVWLDEVVLTRADARRTRIWMSRPHAENLLAVYGRYGPPRGSAPPGSSPRG